MPDTPETTQFEHSLKCWPEHFDAVVAGDKPFDLCPDLLGFRQGDTLLIREWEPEAEGYTGRSCRKLITYVLRGKPGSGVEEGFVLLGMRDAQ